MLTRIESDTSKLTVMSDFRTIDRIKNRCNPDKLILHHGMIIVLETFTRTNRQRSVRWTASLHICPEGTLETFVGTFIDPRGVNEPRQRKNAN